MERGEDVSAVPWIAMWAGEDEVLLVPTGPRRQSILELCPAMLAKRSDHFLANPKRPLGTRGLWLGEVPHSTHEGMLNRDRAAIKVDVSPAEPQKLTLAHPGGDSQQVQRAQSIPDDRHGSLAVTTIYLRRLRAWLTGSGPT
jgi:hypothetical protein